jgi:hypothetical protein
MFAKAILQNLVFTGVAGWSGIAVLRRWRYKNGEHLNSFFLFE